MYLLILITELTLQKGGEKAHFFIDGMKAVPPPRVVSRRLLVVSGKKQPKTDNWQLTTDKVVGNLTFSRSEMSLQ